jgi:hypothetical protein
MDEGRKRVLAIVAGIFVARHLKTADDLFDCREVRRAGGTGTFSRCSGGLSNIVEHREQLRYLS